MDKNRCLIRVIGITLILVMTYFLAYPEAIKAKEECLSVKIFGQAVPGVSIWIEPETLTISKGTCVVWINWARATQVTLKFREGKKCAEATQAPVGFRMDAINCYVSDRILLGGTASLLFTKDGTFDYEVEVAAGNVKRGRIIVKG